MAIQFPGPATNGTFSIRLRLLPYALRACSLPSRPRYLTHQITRGKGGKQLPVALTGSIRHNFNHQVSSHRVVSSQGISACLSAAVEVIPSQLRSANNIRLRSASNKQCPSSRSNDTHLFAHSLVNGRSEIRGDNVELIAAAHRLRKMRYVSQVNEGLYLR